METVKNFPKPYHPPKDRHNRCKRERRTKSAKQGAEGAKEAASAPNRLYQKLPEMEQVTPDHT